MRLTRGETNALLKMLDYYEDGRILKPSGVRASTVHNLIKKGYLNVKSSYENYYIVRGPFGRDHYNWSIWYTPTDKYKEFAEKNNHVLK